MSNGIKEKRSKILAAVTILCLVAALETTAAQATPNQLYEPWGTICTNEYVHERIDTLQGYIEYWSRTYMDGELRMFEITISNYLGVIHPVDQCIFAGFGITTNHSEVMEWENLFYPYYLYVEGPGISNGYGECFTYAAEHNVQQELWKIFTNETFHSWAYPEGPILGTNIFIKTLGPTNEPEPGVFFIVPAGIFLLARYIKQKGV